MAVSQDSPNPPDRIDNPYPFYHQLRSESPLYWDEWDHTWTFTRYAEVVSILRDPRCAVGRIGAGQSSETLPDAASSIPALLSRMMVFMDPPDHTRLRGLVTKAFTPRVIEAMRARIRQIVNDLLDRIQPTGKMEVISDLAFPLPVTVIAEMLGVPLSDRDRFKQWSDAFFAILDGPTTEEQETAFLGSVVELSDYFRRIIAPLHQNPKDDLLSALASAREQNDQLSETELIANCLLLLAAGHETTTNLIGNGVLTLLRHPDQLQKLKAYPDLIASAVEEILRYESPVQWTGRIVAEEMEIEGNRLEKGQYLSVGLGAANRDPSQFPDPDGFDITRRENRHVAFGYGPHFCLGAALARMEGQMALSAILDRLPALRLEKADVDWYPSPGFRRLQSLPVILG